MTHHNAPNPKASPTDATGETEDAPVMSATELALAEIRSRLEPYFPTDPYLPDSLLAQTLKWTLKTLANNRSLKPARYPTPIRVDKGRAGVHPRAELIDWLAREELAAKARSVPRCR